jgi:membrane protease YdiL (CAAX protease family)
MECLSLPAFLLLTPLLSLAIPLFLSLPPEITPLMIAIIPAVLSIALTALTDGGRGVRALLKKLIEWRVSLKWYVIAFGLALGLRLTMSLLALLLGWIPAIQIRAWSPPEFILLGTFILIGGAMEELGWRGYALPRLLASRSALFSALLIGILWGILHLSLTFSGQMNAGSHWLPTILQIIGLSVVVTWLYIQTGGNIVIPILFHAGQNFFVFLNEGITLTQQLWLLTVVTLVYSLVIIFLFGRSLWSRRMDARAVVNVEPLETK